VNDLNKDNIIKKIKILKSPENVKGMARYGINSNNNYGVSIPVLRTMAKEIGSNHGLAMELWDTGIHDARLLAYFIEDPSKITSEQMDAWANDFDSWDICDQACTSLFDKTTHAWKKTFEWAEREEEFVKRGAFSLIAGLSVHDKKAADKKFEQFFPLIKEHSTDERNYVKKSVNWALRNIGKRNMALNLKAIRLGKQLQKSKSRATRWIGNDAVRELQSEAIQQRLIKKNQVQKSIRKDYK